MKSNFAFLGKYWPVLAQIGETAENYLYSDPNACLYKLGMFGERLILEIFAFEEIEQPTFDNTHSNRIYMLRKEGLIPKKIDDAKTMFYMAYGELKKLIDLLYKRFTRSDDTEYDTDVKNVEKPAK